MRNWYSLSPRPSSTCPQCGNSYTKNSPRQKFCTIKCRAKESTSRRPKPFYGTPEYYKRKGLLAQGLKACKECKGVFVLEDFWDNGVVKNSYCKKCAAKRQRLMRKPDRNVGGIRQRSKRWRERHPDLFKQRIRDWCDKHPESVAATTRRRRVRKSHNGICKITANDLRRLFVRQSGCCYLCAQPIIGRKELDHIIPIKRGGRHSIGNDAWTHPKCNRDKYTKLLVEVRYGGRHEPCFAIGA